jgi:OOP family OmpA-OmpF porin
VGPCHAEFTAALDELERSVRGQAMQPAPIPVPPSRQYNVYFDFDKSTLTEDGRKIVDQVAGQAKGANVRVTITGKADLSGTDAYNLGLSKRRAEAVRQALIADGVAAARIDERYVGMREPPVPTAAGVREPRNRVVEIVFH